MPILFVLEILVQITLAIHVVRTGRQLYWLFIILFFPVLGSLVYFVAEVLPDLGRSRTARGAASSVQRALDPDRDLRRLTEELETADTADNRRKLADEHLRRGDAAEALRLYRGALTGIHRDDPTLLMGLARAQFLDGDAAACIDSLDRLKAAHPKIESAEGHLLYARALEGLGRLPEALDTYHAVAAYYPGAEAKCRYALLLRQEGHVGEARLLFQDVARGYEKGKGFHRAQQREWYDIARQNLGT